MASEAALVALTLAGGMLVSAPNANASAVTLLSAAGFDPTVGSVVGYDLLVGNQTAVTLGGSSTTFTASGGAIAQGTYSTSNNGNGSNPDTFGTVTSGGFYEGEWGMGCTPTTSCTAHPYTSNSSFGTITNSAALFNPTGSGIPNNNPIEDAISAAAQATLEAHNSYTGYNGTGTYNALSEGNVTTALTLTAYTASADNVFYLTSLDLNGACLSFSDGTAGSNARFVVDISGPVTMTNACINHTGIGAQDIIFNVEGSGNSVNISGSGNLSGTILAPNSNVTFNNSTLTGEIISGFGSISNGTSYTLQANNSQVNFAAYTPPGRVPEPASMALFGTGLAAMAAIRKRRAAKRRD